jgi:transposase-like protein
MKGVSSLKKIKQYSPEFKLQVVKDYLSSQKSLNDIANEYSVPSVNTVHKWVKKYVDSGYDDNVFISKKGRTKSIISDISKVPPFIYESACIIKSDSNNSDDSDDSALLKKKIEYYERLLLEKELLLKIQEDEINLLKKNTKRSNFYWSLFAYF